MTTTHARDTAEASRHSRPALGWRCGHPPPPRAAVGCVHRSLARWRALGWRCGHPPPPRAAVRASRSTHGATLLFFLSVGGTWGSKHAAARVKTRFRGGRGCVAVAPRRRILLQGCNPRARGSLRGPFRGKSFELPRRKARGDGGGTHGGRGRFPARRMSRGQQEARGARQRVALCFGSCGGRVRLGPSGARRARAKAFWNCVSGFATVRKRLVQANACSGRPRRDPPGCGADGPAQHGRPRGRSRDAALPDRCAPASLLGLSPLPVRCALGPASHALSALRAARGQRVLCGTEWTLCAPTGGGALPRSAASLVPAARAPALARERARVRPQPISYTAHARAAASAVRCEARVRQRPLVSGVAARVFRADPSLGRWRCGSCAFRL